LLFLQQALIHPTRRTSQETKSHRQKKVLILISQAQGCHSAVRRVDLDSDTAPPTFHRCKHCCSCAAERVKNRISPE